MDPLKARNLAVDEVPYSDRQPENPGQVRTCETVYQDLLGAHAWAQLKPEVRQRFSVRPNVNERILYRGVMERVELSFMGWLLTQICRLIGTPLAPYRGRNVKMDIELVWDEKLQGVTWHRTYYFVPDRKFTVRSTKIHGSDGALIEHIGRGFSMRLALSEQGGKLVFTSTRYEVELAGRRIQIPAILTPGVTTVTHEQIAGNRFRFSLSVDHAILGQTIFQEGEFYSPPVNER